MATARAIPQQNTGRSSLLRLARDYSELLKLRISAMVVITAWAGFFLASRRSQISSLNDGLWQTLLGVGMTSCGASALNQVLERMIDARMKRTAWRPMAARRVGLAHGLVVGMSLVVGGSVLLLFTTNLLTAVIALLTVFLYVAIYTPLKRVTTLNTLIGAVPGALPPVIGWTAARGQLEAPALALFAILFCWQFPHFMAIAWLFRDDYRRGGLRMMPVADPSGVSTVLHALFFAVLMIPVSLVPVLLHITGWVYGGVALALGLGYLAATFGFVRILRAGEEAAGMRAAHTLLRASIIYLPVLLLAMVANS